MGKECFMRRKRKWERLLAAVLTVALIFSSLPTSALAEGSSLIVGTVDEDVESGDDEQTGGQTGTETEPVTEAEPATEAMTGAEPAPEAEPEPPGDAADVEEPETVPGDQVVSEAAAFEETMADGVTVKLNAPEGAFNVPAEEVTMTAAPLNEDQKAALEGQLTELAAARGMTMSGYVAYDISLQANGESVQPNVPVQVLFGNVTVPEGDTLVGFQAKTSTMEVKKEKEAAVIDGATVAVNAKHFTVQGFYYGHNEAEEAPADDEIRRNVVTFEVAEGAAVTVWGENVPNEGTAMAKDGTIIFTAEPEEGYEITSVIFDRTSETRKTENENEYILAGIQTDETVISVSTQALETEETEVQETEAAETEVQETETEEETNTAAEEQKPGRKKAANSNLGLMSLLPENTPIATYNFHVEGEETQTQSVADGEELLKPEAPTKEGYKFMGWSTNQATPGEPYQNFGVQNVTETKTVDLYPHFEEVHYVFFMDEKGSVFRTKEGIKNDIIPTTDVNLPVSSKNDLTGWYTSQECLGEPVGDTVTLNQENIFLYPKVEEGYWITFETGEDASHVEPAFYLPNVDTVAPAEPTRIGYRFDGWLDEAGSEYNFGNPISENITLTAKWEAAQAEYTVIYWLENANYNNPYAKTKDEKQYAYLYTDPVKKTGLTGSETNVLNQGLTQALQNQIADYQKDCFYIVEPIDQQTIRGDGSTIVNVYINRQEFTVKWSGAGTESVLSCGKEEHTHTDTRPKNRRGNVEEAEDYKGQTYGCYKSVEKRYYGYSYWDWDTVCGQEAHAHNWWCYSNDLIIKAKYGADIASAWPGGTWSTNDAYQVYLETMPSNGQIFNGKKKENGSETASYYVEVIPGEEDEAIETNGNIKYKKHHDDEAAGTGYYISKEDYYDLKGFTFLKYKLRNGTERSEVKGTWDTYDGAIFYYTRNSYKIDFINSIDNSSIEERTYKYEENLEGKALPATPDAPKTVDGVDMEFVGWFDNPEGTGTPITALSGRMPAKGLTYYAVWKVPTFNANVHVSVNGAEGKVVGTLNIPYGGIVNENDSIFKKWTLENLVKELYGEGANVKEYTFYGWMVKKDGVLTPFNFDTPVTGDIDLYPSIAKAGPFRVTYDANGGEGISPTDSKQYRSGSYADVQYPNGLEGPDGQVFLGWKTDEGDIYQPQDKVRIEDNVTLHAVWGPKPHRTQITYHANFAGAEDSTYVENDLPNNVFYEVKSYEGTGLPEHPGYTFLGWSKSLGVGEAAIKAGDRIYINNKNEDTENHLYAVWERDTGKLTITKKIVDETGEASDERTFTFTISGPEDYGEQTSTITVSAGNTESSITLENIPTGPYTVTENEYSDYITTGSPEAATVEKGETATITIINEKKNPKFSVEKTVSGAKGKDGAAKVGDELTYTVTVKNTGNVDLTGLTLTDEFSVDEVVKNEALTWAEGNPTETFGLMKGETKIFTATYTVQATDNSLSNTAKVGDEEKTVTTPVEGQDAWTVEKTVSGATGADGKAVVGDKLVYTVTVENTGNTDLTGLTLTDEFSVDGVVNNEALAWTAGNPAVAFDLKQGETKTFTATYTVQATDNSLSNTAKVGDETTTIPTPVEDKNAWTVTKTVEGATGENGAAKVGDELTYTVTVENTGNTDLTGLTLKDEFSVDGVVNNDALTWTKGNPAEAFDLEQGGTKTFTATYTVQATDNNLSNTAKVGDETTTIPTPVEDEDAWTVEKTVSGATGENGAAKVGDKLTYTVTVENTGNTDLTGLTLEDNFSVDGVVNNGALTWTEGNPAEAFDLAQGGTKTFTATYTVQAADNNLSNTAKVGDETTTIPTPVENKDAWTVEKTVSGATGAEGKAAVGNKLTYTVTVKNTGNTDLKGLTLTDEFSVSGVVKNDALTWTEGNPAEAFDLAQGETKTFTATYTVQATDTNLSNTAKVGDETTTIPTPVEGKDAWKVTKTVEGAKGENGAAKVGDELTYTVTVENTGNTDLSGLTLTDEFTVDEVVNNEALTWTEGNPTEAFGLKKGETKKFTATYTVQATDNDLNNTAKVGGETGTVPTPVEGQDAWTVTKTVEGATGVDGAAKVGDKLTYTVTVANTGNTDLTGLKLEDNFSVSGVVKNDVLMWTEGSPAVAFDLAQGATKTFTATYTVQSTDSSLSNIATVGDETGRVETKVEENPGLTSDKKLANEGTGENGAFKANETAKFDIVVENTGNTTQTNVVVTDTMAGAKIVEGEGYTVNEDGTATIPTIEAGKSVTVQAEYTVTQADIDNQTKLENTATVEGEGPAPDPEPEPIPTEDKNPGLKTTKTLTNSGSGKDGAFKADETAEFDIVVENTGNTTQHDVVVTDTMAGAKIVEGEGYTVNEDGTATIPTIEVGKSVTVKAEYTVTQTDIDNQTKLANTATVEGEGPTPEPEPEPIPTEEKDPKLTSEKTLTNSGSGKDGAFKAGETATFDIVVENTGNTTQHDVVVTDTMAGAKIVAGDGYTVNEDGTATIPTIEVGKSVTVKAEYTVTQADIDKQIKLANTATVKGEGPAPDPDPEPIPTEGKAPGLTATKTLTNSGTGEGGAFKKGDTAAFDITVTNSGNTTQTNVTVSEQLAGATIVAGDGYTIEGGKAVIAEMAPGATVTVKATYTVTQEDIDSDEPLENIAVVDGDNSTGPDPEPIPEEEKNPELTYEKKLTNVGSAENGGFKAGETATFDIVVENTGNTTQTNVTVSEMEGATIVAGEGYDIVDENAVIAEMAPEDKVTVKATYEVTQADIDSDEPLENIATVNDTPTPGVDIPEEPKNPELTSEKTLTNGKNADGSERKFKAGETAEFEIVVENTGNTTQTNVTVSEMAGATIVEGTGYDIVDGNAVIAEMAPKDKVTVKATYEVTQADIDSDEPLENIATVNDDPTKPEPIPEEEKNPELTSEKTLTNGKNEDGSERKFKAGETAEFDIVVENTGNTTQTNVTVSEMEGATIVEGEGYTINEAGQAVIEKMVPGDKVTVKATYEVTQADIDSDEPLENIATVNDDPTKPEPIPEEEKNPELTSEKTLTNGKNEDGSERKFKAGETAEFNIVVENTGNTTQTNVTVSEMEGAAIMPSEDYEIVDGKAVIEKMAPGAKVTVKATYEVTQADIDSDEPLENIATVNDTPTPGVDIPEEPKNPELTTTKTLTNKGSGKNGEFKANETAEFDIVVENTGNTTQHDVVVTDTMAGATIVEGDGYEIVDGKAVIAEMAQGAKVTVKATYTVTQADIDNQEELENTLANTATVESDETKTGPDPEPVPTDPQQAGLTTTKTLTNKGSGENGAFKANETANFDIVVENTGNTTQHDVVVTETLTGATILEGEGYTVNADGTATIPTIEVGDSVTVKAEYTVTQADIDKQAKLENTATITGDGPTPDPKEEIPLEEENPALEVTKELDNRASTGYKAGDKVRYLVTIENTGNVTLKDVTFTDDHITKVTSAVLGGQINPYEGVTATETSAAAKELKPGQRFVVTYDYIIKNKDLEGEEGLMTNVAKAKGTTSKGTPVNGEDSETISTVGYNPALDAQKSVTNRGTGEDGKFQLGDTVTFDITVKNTGSTIQNVTVSEPDWEQPMEDAVIVPGEGYTINEEGQAVITDMAPGATVVVKATYKMTQTGMDKDILENTAEVDSEGVGSLYPTTAIPRDQKLEMKVTKKALGDVPTKAGDVIRYSVRVENTGNVTLKNLQIKDSLPGITLLEMNPESAYYQYGSTIELDGELELAPGKSVEITYEYTVTQDDVEAGSIENTATAIASSPAIPNAHLEASDTVTRPVVQTPSLETTKTLENSGSGEDGTFKAGETAEFNIVVTNDGNVTQENVIVAEALEGAVIREGEGYSINGNGWAVIDELAPGELVTVKAAYTVTQKDIDNEAALANIATVRGKGNTPDSNPVPIPKEEQNPDFAITKELQTWPESYKLGEHVDYLLKVENTGNTTLRLNVSDILGRETVNLAFADVLMNSITSQFVGHADSVMLVMPPKAIVIFQYSHTVTEEDILNLNGELVNTATAVSAEGTEKQAEVKVRIETPNPHLTVEKTTTSRPKNGSTYALGEKIKYSITVKNDGNLTIDDVTVTDELVGKVWTVDTLAPKASQTFTAEYVVTEADIEKGSVTNVATADGNGPDEEHKPDVTPGETTDPTDPVKKAVTVEKEVINSGNIFKAGDVIRYQVMIRNEGNQTRNLVLTDTFGLKNANVYSANLNVRYEKNEEDGSLKLTLPGGASAVVTYDYEVTMRDIELGPELRNVAVASDEDGEGRDTATATIVDEVRELLLNKRLTNEGTGENGTFKAGETAEFDITVTNNGNTVRRNIEVKEKLEGAVIVESEGYTVENNKAVIAELAPGETVTVKATYTLKQKDIDSNMAGNELSNIAAVNGEDTPPAPIPAEPRNPGLSVTKTVTNEGTSNENGENGEKLFKAGDTARFDVVVENTGNTTQARREVIVTEQMEGAKFVSDGSVLYSVLEDGEKARINVDMAPGMTITLKAVYTVTQEDIDEGRQLTNIVMADGETGTNPDPTDEEKIPTEPRDPGLTVEKTVTNAPEGGFKAGETAKFDITVTNSGNTTQRNVIVGEQLDGAKILDGDGYGLIHDNAFIAEMAPGATVVVKAEYTVTQDDIDSEEPLKNIAKVWGDNGEEPDPTPEVDIPEENQRKSLAAVKTVTNAPEGGFKAGETAKFDITVTNTGNTTQKNVTVTEQLENAEIMEAEADENGVKAYEIVDGHAVIAEMAPGAKVVVKATYEVTQADIDSDAELKNIAVIGGGDPTDPVPDPEIKIPEENQRKSLSAVKTVANMPESGFFRAGETAVFDITVKNTGNTTQKNVTVTEQLENAEIMEAEADENGVKAYEIVDGHAVIAEMAPNAVVVVKAAYTVTQEDIDDDAKLKNIVAIGGGDPTDPVPNPEVEIPKEPKEPGLAAVKTVTSAQKDKLFKAGETAEFDITVTNTGNTTQKDVVVAEQLEGAKIVAGEGYTINAEGQAVIAEMAPDAVVVVKATYEVTQEDIDSDEELKNIAKVGPEDGPEPEVTIPEEPKNPVLTSAKTLTNAGTGENGAFKAGETAEFNITVTNRGNTTQRNVVVTEQLDNAVIVPGTGYTINEAGQAVIAEMAPDAVVVVKAAYEVTQADIDSNAELKNIALVEGDNGTNPDPEPEIPIPTDPKEGHLTITKTTTSTPAPNEDGTPKTTYALGETITYEITATNDGNLTLTDITVTDELTGDSWAIESLASEASETFTAEHVVTEADVLAGSVVNVATATGTSPDPDEPDVPVDPGEKEDPTEPKDGHVTITKTTTSTPENGTAYALGETITYEITATNDGNLTLTDITVTDELTGDEWTIESLVPGETSETFTASHEVTEEDILAGRVLNVATATGTSPDPDEPDVPVDPGEKEDPTQTPAPSLFVAKTAEQKEGGYALGDTVAYTIRVTNNGNVTLTDVTVTDPLTGLEENIGTLEPNETYDGDITTSYTVTEADILEGEIRNTATAVGIDQNDEEVTNADDAVVQTASKNGHVTITKTTTSEPADGEAYVLGETITYEITATNDGNLTLTNVVVTDELTRDSWTIESLAPDASETFTASHVVTEADILAGSVVNVATATGTSPDPEEPEVPVEPGTEEVPTEPKDGHLTIAKAETSTPENGEAYALGETVTYEITATNDGNLTLTNVVVTDEMTGDSWTIAGLAPGTSESFTASHVVTEADILAGSVVNVATATGTSPDPEEPEVPVDPGTEEVTTEPKDGHLTITKEAADAPANGTAYELGETVTYSITAANDGNLTLTDIVVTDELTGDTWTVDSLVPGASESFTATHVVTEADILAGSVVNVATATGTSPDPEEPDVPVTPGTEEIQTETKDGHLTIAKTTTSTPANGTAYELGETITYSITAANDGNLTITDITVTDELTADSWTVESLAPGESQTFTASHVVTEADTLAGSVVNTAVAAGTSPDPDEPEVPVTPGQEEVLTEDRNPAVAIDKAVTSTPASAGGRYAAGETVTYQVTVTNTGNLTLENLTLEDMITRPGGAQVVPEGIEEGLAGVESLAPGESAVVTYSYVVTEADLGGSLVNNAVVEGTPVIPDPTPETPELQPQDNDSETVLTEEPADSTITISKTNVDGLTGELLSLPGAQFYVALFADEQLTQRVSGVQTLAFGEDQATVSAAFEGLEPGTYYIAETDAEGNVLTGGEYDGGTFTPEYAGGQQVVITESGQSTAIAFQNLFAVLPEEGYSRMAELTVTKEVRDTSGAPMNSDETFYAGLFYDEACTVPAEGVSQQIIPFEMNGGSSASATAEVTILGDGSDTVLYVTEVTADGTPVKDAADFPYEVTVEGGKVTVNADSPEASARIINVAEEPGRNYYEAGELTITKEVRDADGKRANSNETFYAGIFSDSAYTTLADNVSQPVVELNMEGAFRTSASVEVSIADGDGDTILYVTEVTEDGKPVSGSASFAYDVTVEGGTVVMNGNALERSVTIVNTGKASAEEPGEPEEPGTEEPGTEGSGIEEPGTEEPGAGLPEGSEPGDQIQPDGNGGDNSGGGNNSGDDGSNYVPQSSVRTGDETPIVLYLGIFLAAAAVLIVLFFGRRRRVRK